MRAAAVRIPPTANATVTTASSPEEGPVSDEDPANGDSKVLDDTLELGVGEAVGLLAVGDVVGGTVGEADGDADGATVGAVVGVAVGVVVGVIVGDVVGIPVIGVQRIMTVKRPRLLSVLVPVLLEVMISVYSPGGCSLESALRVTNRWCSEFSRGGG